MYPSPLERKWGTAPQAIAAFAHVFTGGLLTWLPALVIHWLWQGRSRFVAFHALQTLYLSFGLFLTSLVGGFLVWTRVFALIGMLLGGASWLLGVVLLVVGAFAAAKGEAFEYPVVGRIPRRKVGL